MREDNSSRTVLELLQLLTLIGQAEAEVSKWRDRAGYNGFRPYRFKHEAEEIPKRLKQSEMILGALQENLKLWPSISRLRTMAEAEGRSLSADWFKQWKAKRGIELGCFDGIDEMLLVAVMESRSCTSEPLGAQTEANSENAGASGVAIQTAKVSRGRRKGGGVPESFRLIVAALLAHHFTGDGLNQVPLSPTDLAAMLSISKATVTRFYKRWSGGYQKGWVRICRDERSLRFELNQLKDPATLERLLKDAASIVDPATMQQMVDADD